MKNKLFLLPLISLLSLSACSKVNYEPGDPLKITSIEMSREYGECTLIQFNNYDIVVDSGTGEDASHINEVLNNKITDREIDLLVVTHPHGDHIGGIISGALDGFIVKSIVDYGYTFNVSGNEDEIVSSSYVNRYVSKRNAWVASGANYTGIKEQYNKQKITTIDKANNLSIRWLKNDYYFGQNETFPNSSVAEDNPNITSVSFVLEYKYWNLIMCGDIDSTYGEASIKENHAKLFNDEKKKVILKANHHASSSSLGYNFLEWCHPNLMFVSAALIDSVSAPNNVVIGSGNGQQNHPNPSTIRRMKKTTENVYWNAINGDITLSVDGVNDYLMTGAGRHKDYYQKGTTTISSRDNEKNITFFSSDFYQYYR